MAAVLALLGAVLLGTGSARQHAVAASAEKHAAMDPRLIGHLARTGEWRLGIVMTLIGGGCISAAIATGRLAVVEPLGSTQVLFALLWSARRARTPLGRREWRAIAATLVGLAGFLLVAAPKESVDGHLDPAVPWSVPLGLLAAGVAVGLVVSRRVAEAGRGLLYAVLAGLAFGVADGVLKLLTTNAGDHGLAAGFTSWPLYTWVAITPVAFLLQQSAYHSTHLGAAMPATSTLAPTTATLLGAAMFGEQLRGGAAIPVEVAFFVLLLVGVAGLARAQPAHVEPAAAPISGGGALSPAQRWRRPGR